MTSVDLIKSKLDIVSVVGTYVHLEKAGGSFKGKCPFHNEKTPSFFVSPDRGNYYCFGCHAKGDIFTFVQEFEGLDFVGSLKVLAERAGVELETFVPEAKTEKDLLYSVLEQATFFFEKNFSDAKSASDYLAHRGLKKETVSEWRLGFVPLEWRSLYDFLLAKNISPEVMLKAGLVKKKEGSETGFYDTFRGRITFPISDSSGRIVGFSGRILVDDGKSPKYLNSPETVLFNKSDILYGLNKAKSEIRGRDYSILVEGQMDLVMLHQAGFKNTVASSGTALTREHLVRLQRLSNRIIMAFDGDSAGLSAISRGATIALSLGMEVKVAEMPKGMDPADVALKDSEMLKQIIKNSKHIISFVLDSVMENNSEPRLVSRKVVSDVLPYVAFIQSSSEQSYFIREISQKTRIKEEALWDDLKKVSMQELGVINKIEKGGESMPRVDNITRRVIGIILWQKNSANPILNYKDLVLKAEEIIGKEEVLKLSEYLSKDSEALLFEIEAYYNNRDTLKRDVNDLLENLLEEHLKKKLIETQILMNKADLLKDVQESTRLLGIVQQISNQINKLKNRDKS